MKCLHGMDYTHKGLANTPHQPKDILGWVEVYEAYEEYLYSYLLIGQFRVLRRMFDDTFDGTL